MTIEKRSADDMLQEAIDAMRKAYATHYRSIGDELMEEARKGEFGEGEEAREKAMEWLDQSIDGDGWVIYTMKAQAVCLVSDNDGAYIDDFGTDGVVEDGAVNWSRMAYGALRADVLAYVDAHGFDINDPESWKADAE